MVTVQISSATRDLICLFSTTSFTE